jgi:hypothetical protein
LLSYDTVLEVRQAQGFMPPAMICSFRLSGLSLAMAHSMAKSTGTDRQRTY